MQIVNTFKRTLIRYIREHQISSASTQKPVNGLHEAMKMSLISPCRRNVNFNSCFLGRCRRR